MIIKDKTPHRTIKQYQNDKGVVMFIDDTKTFQSLVSYCDTTGKKIDNNDDRALTFFTNGPYLVMELSGE